MTELLLALTAPLLKLEGAHSSVALTYLFKEIDLILLCYDLVKLTFVKCGTD